VKYWQISAPCASEQSSISATVRVGQLGSPLMQYA
jgi:hypothetical protein